MNFQESVKTCFSKYVDFNGRAVRSEYWWFALFNLIVSIVLTIISPKLLANIYSLATLLPALAVGVRRLHETNRSGWWLLLWLVPVIGWIVLIVFLAQDSVPEETAE